MPHVDWNLVRIQQDLRAAGFKRSKAKGMEGWWKGELHFKTMGLAYTWMMGQKRAATEARKREIEDALNAPP